MTFKKGQSGNPLGKAKGIGKVQRLREQIAEALPEIIEHLIVLARTGDTGAAKLLLERAIPALKPQSEPVTFTIANNDNLGMIDQSLIDAVSRLIYAHIYL